MQQRQQQARDAAGGAEQQLQMRGGNEEEDDELQVLGTWDCGSPLYDSFELASLHYVLEKHTMVLPFFPDTDAVLRSWRRSQRWHRAAPMTSDMAKTAGNHGAGTGAARRRGSKATAAAIFRAVTCWRRSSV